MPGRPNVITQNANGAPANPSADIVSACAIIAPAYQGTLQTKQYSRRKQVYEQYLEGPLVRASVHCIETAGVPVITQRCVAASNVGAYDTIDNAGFTGTAVPAVVASSVPRNECELYFVCVEGGTIGTAGITYRLSTAAGRGIDAKDIQRLGTGSRLTFGDTGAAIDLDPPAAQVTALVTRTNELRTDAIAHMALTTGTVHTSADTTSDDGIAAACTNVATAISLMGTIVTGLGLHFARGSGASIHINVAGDNTTSLAAAIAAQAVAVASGAAQDAIKALAAITAAYAIHLANVVAHTIADATNTVTAPVPTTGTVVAGDIIQCQTFAPTPTTTELATAFTTISEGDKLPGLVLLPWRVTPDYGATITTGLNLLRDNGLPCRCIVQARRFDVGSDTDLETYRDNLETEWSSITDDRITVVATDLLFVLADGSATLSIPEKRLTGGAISFAARAIATPLGRTTWAPSDGPIEGGSLVDDDGALIGWNEPLGVQTRLLVFYRVPDAVFGRPTVPSKDFCLTDPTSSIKSLRVGRILDQVDRIVRSFAWNEVGLTAAVTINPSNTAQGVLSEDSRQDLIRRCAAKLESDPVLQSSVTNLSDSDLVTLESDVMVEGDVVFLEFGTNINPRLGVGKITFTHNVKTGGN